MANDTTGRLFEASEPAHYHDLPACLDTAWRMLAEGATDRRSAFHAPMASSVGLDGRPRVRVVILRGCDPASRRLRFHTDRRSDKFAELARHPAIALTAYDAAAKIQVRIEGEASLHTDDAVADDAWDASRRFSRICYGVEPAPGVAIADGGGFRLPEADDEINAGRAHFAAVVIEARTLEFLYLASAGHRRARFSFGDPAEAMPIEATWLAP